MVKIVVSEGLKNKYPGIHLPFKVIDVNVKMDYNVEPLIEEVKQALKGIRLENLKEHPLIRTLRNFYWKVGIDPTKTRPASEALVRRFLREGKLPKINNVVDAGNYASLITFIPIGLYDFDVIRGDLILRFAYESEKFQDITGMVHTLSKSIIVLSDEIGLIHQFPYRDSYRTRITNDTKKVLILGCGIDGIDPTLTTKAVDKVIEFIKRL